jgi:transcriptional antiterminator RfaH
VVRRKAVEKAGMESVLNQTQQFSSVDTSASRESAGNDRVAWFCVRTHAKHEHIAAAQLRQERDVEVFLPRIRYKRPTRSGMAWVTEALFRDYLFARFDLDSALRRIQAARSVRGVVHFGYRWPAIGDEAIAELQAAMGGQEVRQVAETLRPGDAVKIGGGPMHSLEAVVTRVMPARERVAVLIEFLGRQTMVELNRCQLKLADTGVSRKEWFPVWEVARESAAAA